MLNIGLRNITRCVQFQHYEQSIATYVSNGHKDKGKGSVNGRYPMTQLRSVTCTVSHSVTCHPTQVSIPRL